MGIGGEEPGVWSPERRNAETHGAGLAIPTAAAGLELPHRPGEPCVLERLA